MTATVAQSPKPDYRRRGTKYRFVRKPIVLTSGNVANLFARMNRPLGLGDGDSGAYFALDGVSDPNGPFRAWQWPGCYTQHYSDVRPPQPGETAEVALELNGRLELRVNVKVRQGTGLEDGDPDLRSRYLRELGCRRR